METEVARAVRPYAPSWFDQLVVVLGRSPVPGWVIYVALGVASVTILLAADVASGDFPLSRVAPFHIFLALVPWLALWFMEYLDQTAERALRQAGPVMKSSAETRERLRYELTTMPARPVLLLTVVGALSVIPIMAGLLVIDPEDQLLAVMGVARSSPSLWAFLLVMGLSYAIGFVFILHAWRQLRLVSRIYEEEVVVDLAALGPLYSFSRISALTAIGIQLQALLWIVTNPAAGGLFIPVVSVISLTFVSAVIFMVPLWGIHRRISDEKGRRLADNARRRETLMAELSRGVDGNDLARATPIKDALLAHEIEARAFAVTRTWPWEPETLRLLLTAVLLPTALFVLQFVLREFLGT